MRQALIHETTKTEDSRHINLFRAEQLNLATKANAVTRPGEPTQAEKEAMSMGAMVGRSEIAKPWYTKHTMPVEIKAALSDQ